MVFKTDGFLSPKINDFTVSLRKVPAYKSWLEFSEGLNHLGWGMLEGHETPTTDTQRLTISVLFIRAHRSFQAAIVLIEKGMLSDARVVLRSAVEGAIALNALANDATFNLQIIEAHLCNQRRIAGIILNTPAYRNNCTQAEIAQMKMTIKEVNEKETKNGRKFQNINWDNVATKHCSDLYILLYRNLSNDGTHTNINAMHRLIEYDNCNQPTGLRFGPDTSDLVEVLQSACLMFLWSADPFARAHAPQFRKQISDKIQQFHDIPGKEPTDVSVVANYAE